ncbi:PPOX class probable FMN-dependent enzyme [Rhodococcus sp. 27YEA15]|uniref:pyridoxamine 5'-phosphate oxidase family protein n=1 Tax=Rhodococcus sp. 27YEA15 TaxID=3156259 RepID=UPI003C7B12D7
MNHRIESLEELNAVLGEPHPVIMEKHTAFTTPLIRDFIEQARFFVLATADAQGNCDCSPRGDLLSQVHFPDEKTLILPDRPGNRRADSYRNMLENPHVGIMFLAPGHDEIVRVNGTAALSTDPELLASMAMSGKPALLAVIVRIDEAYVHCARAILRAKLWDPSTWPSDDDVPSLRDMTAQQHNRRVEDMEPARKETYRKYLY